MLLEFISVFWSAHGGILLVIKHFCLKDVNAFDIAGWFCHWGNGHHLSLLSCAENVDLTAHGETGEAWRSISIPFQPSNMLSEVLQSHMNLGLWNEDSRNIVSLQKINYGSLGRERLTQKLSGFRTNNLSSCHTGVKQGNRLFIEDLTETAEWETQVREHRWE